MRKPASYYEFGPFLLDVAERRLLRDGQTIPLTRRAFETLLVLVQNNGRVIEKGELMKKIWQDSFVEEATLAQNIFTLRKILEERPNEIQYIETVPKYGYRFVAKVNEWSDERQEEVSKKSTEPDREIRSLAVLPFTLLMPGEDYEHFGIAMADALITKLSNVKKISVRPTSAILKYAHQNQDSISIGKELKVKLVLEGKIILFGDRMRVTLQLIHVQEGIPLWADKFDEKLSDIFTLQDKISEQILKVLTLKLTSSERKLLAKHPTENSEAYQEYIKGRHQWNKWTEQGFQRSIQYFERAFELDLNYALSHAGISDAYNALAFYGLLSPLEAMPRAKVAAQRALEIDDSLAEAHLSLAAVLFFYHWNWPEAEKEFNRALELNPDYATAYQGYGLYLIALGRFDEALAMLKRSLELDPASLLINTTLGFPYYFAGQYDEAIKQYRKALEMDPTFGLAHLALGDVYVHKQMPGEAIAEYKKAVELLGQSPDALGSLGYAYAISDKTSEAKRIITKLKKISKYRYISQVAMAVIYTGLGEKGQALDWLEKGLEAHSNKLVYLNVNPIFNTIRSDRRYLDLLRRLGFASDPPLESR